MRFLLSLAVSALATTALARSLRHVENDLPAVEARRPRNSVPEVEVRSEKHGRSTNAKTIIAQNANTDKFAVDGTAIPDVPFDIGESYAGLLPISDDPDASQLYFWFFPSANPLAEDEITIWLNGGPGCSSLEGLLQENGPFLWQYGTFAPVKNPYTWQNLTNMVWVEQPAGTGFSQVGKTPKATDEIEVAAQFLGFFKKFVDTFGLHGKKIYITGESYAGYFIPYIADAMYNATDKDYYNVQSILMYDPVTNYEIVQDDIPAVAFVDYWSPLFSLNQTFMDDIHKRSALCGYDAFLAEALTFPPNGPLPTPPNVDGNAQGCSLWIDIANASQLVNPCWDAYHVANTCPQLWDVLGNPGSVEYIPPGATVYFNRPDVQKAINAPSQQWKGCTDGGVLDTDNSLPSGLSVLPRVIEKNVKTVIGHGMLDFVLLMNGTLMMINNMTWSGAQGFSAPPEDDFFVPYHSELSPGTLAGAGVMGKWHTERTLTFCTINLSGHMVPQYQPAAAYRQLEFLLGRIETLGQRGDLTTQTGNFGNDK